MAMGDVAIVALVKEVVRRLTSEVFKEFDLLWGIKGDILSLKEDFTNIQVVLEDAQWKHIKEKEVDLWVMSLRSACLKVENVLLIKLDIRRKLDAIKSRRSELGLKLTPGDLSHVDVDVTGEMPNRETSSLIHDSLLVLGRNEEMERVTEKICNKDIGKHENGEIRVYGIWGMGGVRKTTLAQLVYNHERINQYFELKCWIYVSENFQHKEIIKGIITSIDKCECTLTSLDVLQESFQNKLRGKKFLIVLDDVWIEDGEKKGWEELSKALSCGAEGSIVLMTTRSRTTSQMFAKVPELQHNLGCLSEEDSLLLFKKFAFAQGREGGDISELKPIGREMVEKCKGLPLAVKTLGSLMWSKRSTRDWEHVKDNII
ncbi:hypothetical protein SSX86_003448 [Deinandra increscens subsp. villosa]|uniref:Uncharacterized protein n=1 Tax=Deinandra increscens subsp. villosa TaxID=3103831 RepID=A0AAP0DQ66_9ASTR